MYVKHKDNPDFISDSKKKELRGIMKGWNWKFKEPKRVPTYKWKFITVKE